MCVCDLWHNPVPSLLSNHFFSPIFFLHYSSAAVVQRYRRVAGASVCHRRRPVFSLQRQMLAMHPLNITVGRKGSMFKYYVYTRRELGGGALNAVWNHNRSLQQAAAICLAPPSVLSKVEVLDNNR